jgi:hypothetical protein
MNKNIIILALGICLFAIFCLSLISAATIYVDKNLTSDCLGSNYSIAGRNCFGSDGNAYTTIRKSMNVATAGDIVLIRGGNYSELEVHESDETRVFNHSGTANAYITYRSYPGESAAVVGPGKYASMYSVFELRDNSYIKLQNLEIWNISVGINCAINTSNIIISNMSIHDNFRGIDLHGACNNITIENINSYRIGIPTSPGQDANSLLITGNSSNIIVVNFSAHENDDGGAVPDESDGDGFHVEGAYNITFINSSSWNNTEDGFDLTGQNITLINCKSFLNRGVGIKMFNRIGDSSEMPCPDYYFFNVQAYNNSGTGATVNNAIYSGSPVCGPNLYVYNSVFYGNGEEGIALYTPAPNNSIVNIYNSIIMRNGYGNPFDNPPYGYTYGGVSTTQGWNLTSDYNLYYNNSNGNETCGVEGNHTLGSDPLFANASASNFTLLSGSPAIDKGKDLSGIFNYDFNGRLRPQDGDNNGSSEWDMGAYEYNLRTIYVDKNLTLDCLGNNYSIANRNCSGSDGMAFNTIQEGVNNATPGDTVYIIGSTNSSSEDAIYNVTGNGITTVRVGLPEQRITIRSYPGQTVIIQGDGGDAGIYLDYANYTTFKGLIFKNFSKATESWAYKTDTVIENCEFTQTYETGLRLRDVHNFIMRDSYVHQCFETGISVRDCDNVTFENVESSYNDDGQGADGDGDGFATSTCGTVNFYNCTARGNSEDGFDLTSNSTLVNCIASGQTACNVKLWRREADNYAPKNYTIINSMFYGAGQAGIKASAGAEMHLYNSVIYGNGEEGVAFRAFNISGWPLQVYSTIKNSIIAKNGYEGIGIDQYLGDGYVNSTNNVSADYNIFYNNSAANNGLSSNTHNISANPLFFAPVVNEFHLRPGSPAIDNGTSLVGVVDSDFDGLSRPQDGDNNGSSEWDMGAYESYSPPGNQGPNFTYTGNTSFEVFEGVELSIQLNATDAGNDSLRYIIFDGNIVSEMSINNSGFFSFTPNFDRSNSTNNNTYNITIAVTDEHYYYPPDQINVSIRVINVNRAPVYSGLSRYTLIEGRKFRIKLPMSDADGDVFSNTLYNLTQNSVYNNITRIITWTPNSSEIGNHVFNLNVSDWMNSSNYSINFEVFNLTPYQQPSQNNTFYVDGINGNNSYTGNSTDNAWKTIQKAKDTITAGQMVLIRGGDYYEYGGVAHSGNTTLPVIFKAYPGETVLMHGRYPNRTSVKYDSSPEGFDFSTGISNIAVDGLHFVDFSETLYLRGSNENISLLNLVIQDADDGIYGGANNLRIENLMVNNIGDRGIYGGDDNIHIYNVTINNASDRGISLYSDSYDNINIIKANISGCGNFGILAYGKNVLISESVIADNYYIGADIGGDYAYIQNSIFSGTKISSGNAYNLLFGTSTEFELLNSVVFNSSQYGLYLRGTGNHSVENCIIYNNSQEVRTPTGFNLSEDYNIFGSGFTPRGNHSFRINPLFVDASDGNFRLKTGSPAVDNGTNTSVYSDIEGNIRPRDGDGNGSAEWDIGAYEYIQSPPLTPAPLINSNLLGNTTIEDLNCSATILDLNGDDLNVSLGWYKNDNLSLSFDDNNSYTSGASFSSILKSGNLTTGDVWKCSVRMFDGANYSSWGNSSNLTILPQDLTAPNVSLISPVDSYSTTSTSITFSYNVTDSSNIANCSLIVDGSMLNTTNLVLAGVQQNFTQDLAVGSYSWNINCTDVFNNIAGSAARIITVTSSGGGDGGIGGSGGGRLVNLSNQNASLNQSQPLANSPHEDNKTLNNTEGMEEEKPEKNINPLSFISENFLYFLAAGVSILSLLIIFIAIRKIRKHPREIDNLLGEGYKALEMGDITKARGIYQDIRMRYHTLNFKNKSIHSRIINFYNKITGER